MREEKNLERIREVIEQVVKRTLCKLKVAELEIEPAYGSIGDPIIWVRVIYKGSYGRNKKHLAYPGTLNVQREALRQIKEQELSESYPVFRFIAQPEWEEVKAETADEFA